MNSSDPAPSPLRSAAHFWEPGRLLYNAVLFVIVLIWIVLTWPHFRPAFTVGSLEVMLVLALMANLCYSAAYVVDVPLQHFLRGPSCEATRPVVFSAKNEIFLRRFRRTLWILGMLFGILLENYWIVDEIYPYADQPPAAFGAANPMSTAHIASNINFPAPFAVVGFLAAAAGLFLTISAALIFWFARKPHFARRSLLTLAAGAVVYVALLLGFSAASRSITLARGQEKYFCEIDCHLAYSIVGVQARPGPSSTRYRVTVRTRFDEATISPSRPKDAPLTPSPREEQLIDGSGDHYAPASTVGTPLLTPLKPGDSFTTQLEFDVPNNASGLRLLIRTTPGWPDHLVVGDENSWLHKKTYFAL
jgi:hypothetical protein